LICIKAGAAAAFCSAKPRISARPVVVFQDREPRPLQIVELAALQRAPERPADQEYERLLPFASPLTSVHLPAARNTFSNGLCAAADLAAQQC